MKSHTYEHIRGLQLGTSYSDNSITRSFTYNHLGQMTQQVDDAGIRTFGYNSYGERESDSLVVDGDTHLIVETRDSFGRSTGFVYSKNGSFSIPSPPDMEQTDGSVAPDSPTAARLSSSVMSTSAAPTCCISSPSRTT